MISVFFVLGVGEFLVVENLCAHGNNRTILEGFNIMTIEAGKVVSFHYTVKEDGNELESSTGGHPVLYLHGHNNMLDGIEEALTGKTEGDAVTVTLPPEKTYGLRKEGQTMRVPLKHIVDGKKKKIRKGDTVAVNTAHGVSEMVVLKVGLKNVDVDANHPFAGKTLDFDLEVVEVRDATSEELAHGHAHGKGGHEH